jgi:hypothetical protein
MVIIKLEVLFRLWTELKTGLAYKIPVLPGWIRLEGQVRDE